MAFPSRQAAIVGLYNTEWGRGLERSSSSLTLEAIKGAVADAGLTMDDVDGLVPQGAPFGGNNLGRPEQWWAAQLGGRTYSFGQLGLMGGLVKAALGISAGMADVVVVFWGKAGYQIGPGDKPVPGSAPRALSDFGQDMFGGFPSTWYATWAQRYMYEFGATSEDLAEVAVIHREHATLNPGSLMGGRGKITVEDVVNSRMIADPLHLLDCAQDNDGGYAIVLASEEVARSCAKKPVWVIGGAEAMHTDTYSTVDAPWFREKGAPVQVAGDRAFAMAGVSRDDIDVAGLYDCFTITMIRDLEELGFCKLGEGAAYVKEGHTRLGGSMPCNTDGGLLSNSHCGMPHGLFTVEVARQLRGECGERQVKGAKIGISLGQGASVHGNCGTLIMAVD